MVDVDTLKVLMYREDADFSAVCLVPYLVVRGADELEVRQRIVAVFDSYRQSGNDAVRALGTAPANYFKDWFETDGDPRALTVEVPASDRRVKVKVKQYHRSAFGLDAILA